MQRTVSHGLARSRTVSDGLGRSGTVSGGLGRPRLSPLNIQFLGLVHFLLGGLSIGRNLMRKDSLQSSTQSSHEFEFLCSLSVLIDSTKQHYNPQCKEFWVSQIWLCKCSEAQMRFSPLNIKFLGLVHILLGGPTGTAALNPPMSLSFCVVCQSS